MENVRPRSFTLLYTFVAALSLVMIIAVGLPGLVYSANAPEFRWPFSNIVVSVIPYAAGAIAVLTLPALIPSRKFSTIWLGAIGALALSAYVFGVFRPGDLGLLDGSVQVFGRGPLYLVVDYLILFGLAAASFAGAFFAPRLVPLLSLSLAISLAVQVVPEIAKAWPRTVETDRDVDQLLSLSSERNVIVVLMDTMQSDLFKAAVDRDEGIQQSLDGFVYYPNMLGAAPTTYLSMPAIHAGMLYDGNRTLGEFYETAVRDHSFLTDLSSAGFDSVLFNPVQGVCPTGAQCQVLSSLLMSDRSRIQLESRRLLDVVLYRIAPYQLKPRVFNEGQWLLQRKGAIPELSSQVLSDVLAFGAVAERTEATAAAPKALFYHLLSTHPPYHTAADCSYDPTFFGTERVNAIDQIACGLKQFTHLLDKLKQSGTYDNSLIVLMADHGTSSFPTTNYSGPRSIQRVISSASPAFAIKPFGSNGAFRTDVSEVAISQVPEFVCSGVPGCQLRAAAAATEEPTRRFASYTWQHEFWNADTIDNIEFYDVRGRMFNGVDWTGLNAPLEQSFTKDNVNEFLLGGGWSEPEEFGVWSSGPKASLYLPSTGKQTDHIELDIGVFYQGSPVEIAVYSNDDVVFDATLSSDDLTTIAFEVPNPNGEGAFALGFEFKGAKSPASLGLGGDVRELAIKLVEARVSAASEATGEEGSDSLPVE